MSKLPEEYLKHILQECSYLMNESEKITLRDLLVDETRMRAFARSLEIIGEAVKKLDAPFREDHSEIDWKAVAGMRDRLIHGYFSVDYEIVWDVVKNEIPPLKLQIEKILHS